MSDTYSPDPPGSDRITETTSQNVFQRMGGALAGAAVGVALFLVAVGVLVWNESRAVDAMRGLRQAAHDAIEASPSPIDAAQNGRLVHLTGALVAHDKLSDPEMGLSKTGLVHLRRTVEMYQWEEHKDTRSSSQVGGTQTTQTTYTYAKKWSEDPIDSGGFKGNHVNPEMPIRTQVFTSSDTSMGERKLTSKLLDELAAYSAIPPPATVPDGYRRDGGSFYRGRDADAPAIGDVRITFTGVPAQTVSVLAEQRGSALAPYKTASGYKVGLVVPGDVDADDMVAHKRSEERLLTWILRSVGLLCFFFALLLLAGPVEMVADILPVVGSIVGGGTFFFAAMLSIPLTLVTIALSWVAVRPFLGLGLLAAAALVVFAFRRFRRPRTRAA